MNANAWTHHHEPTYLMTLTGAAVQRTPIVTLHSDTDSGRPVPCQHVDERMARC